MVHAFVLIKTTPGQSTTVVETARKHDAVTEAHVVAGEYDVIVELEGVDVYSILEAVTGELRGLEEVVDTRTYVSLGG